MLSAYIHLRLLPQVWRRLVNSAGQKFQTSTIISETKTLLLVRLTPTPDLKAAFIIALKIFTGRSENRHNLKFVHN